MKDFRRNGIWHCQSCGVKFMNPQYSDSHLEKFYADYFSSQVSEQQHLERLKVFSSYFSIIERFIDVGDMLDIGCGDGHLLESAIARGWRVEGYDVDKPTTRSVSERLKVEVESGDFLLTQFSR